MPDDYAETLRRQQKRRALIMLGVLLVAVAALVVGLRLAVDEVATPKQPLGSFPLTRQRQSFDVSMPEAGSLTLWIEVEQVHEDLGWSGSPPGAPIVVVESDDGAHRCETTEVVAFGHLSRNGARVSWNGQLKGCTIDGPGGAVALTAWWEPSTAPRNDVVVKRVVLTPSLDR